MSNTYKLYVNSIIIHENVRICKFKTHKMLAFEEKIML